MKKRIVTVAVVLALTGAGAVARASECSREGHDSSATSGEHRDARGQRLDRWAAVLKLTDSQKAQISTLFEAERSAVKPQFEAVREARHALRSAEEGGTFDEAAVRALAQKQAQAQTELTVERARVKSKVLAALTPDQRELLKSLRPLLEAGRRHEGAAF